MGYMKRKDRLALGVIALALTGAACAEASGDPMVGIDGTKQEVRATKALLIEAGDAARDYGRDHLGHYLDLRVSDVAVAVPEDASMNLWSGHTGYCITLTNRSLPSIHPWRMSSIGDGGGPSEADRCKR